MTGKILIIEEKKGLARTLRDRLRKEGYRVTVARNSNSGMDLAARKLFDLLILYLMLPGQNSFATCQNLGKLGLDVPILMLTARRRTTHAVAGLRTDIIDYVTKPLKIVELLAPVGTRERPSVNQYGDVRIDFRATEVRRGNNPISLSAMEFQLLQYFVEHHGATLSRDELMREVWGYRGKAPSTRTVDVHVSWLRRKLERDPKKPRLILTMVGLGYKFVG